MDKKIAPYHQSYCEKDQNIQIRARVTLDRSDMCWFLSRTFETKMREQLLSNHPRSGFPAYLVALFVGHLRELLKNFVRRHLSHYFRKTTTRNVSVYSFHVIDPSLALRFELLNVCARCIGNVRIRATWNIL